MDQIILVVAAAIQFDGKYLIARRGPGQVGAGLWEFPGGKVDSGETEIEALRREILEELSLEIDECYFLAENIHQYPTKKIHLKLYEAKANSTVLKLVDHDLAIWVDPVEMQNELFSEADKPFVQLLKSRK